MPLQGVSLPWALNTRRLDRDASISPQGRVCQSKSSTRHYFARWLEGKFSLQSRGSIKARKESLQDMPETRSILSTGMFGSPMDLRVESIKEVSSSCHWHHHPNRTSHRYWKQNSYVNKSHRLWQPQHVFTTATARYIPWPMTLQVRIGPDAPSKSMLVCWSIQFFIEHSN